MIRSRLLTVSVACLALAACGGGLSEVDALTNPAPCPTASVLFDAARTVEFHGEQELANVGFTGEFLGVRSLCRYDDEGGPIEADLEVDFAFGRGQAAQGNSHTYRYFVAVTRRDSVVLAKETFEVTANFGGDAITYEQDEIDRIIIPRANNDVSGANFEIFVGFELTPEQLAFNRSGVRFRPDAGGFTASGG